MAMSGNDGRRTRPPGIGEFLFNELRQAFQDIRQKVVEEGWFSRVTTPKPVVELGREPIEEPVHGQREIAPEYRPSFDDLYRPMERSPEAREHGREHSHQHDIDIER
jgi:hypothetical protein